MPVAIFARDQSLRLGSEGLLRLYYVPRASIKGNAQREEPEEEEEEEEEQVSISQL